MIKDITIRSRGAKALAAALLATSIAGCSGGEGPDLLPVSGQVTYQGKAVGYGQVTLYPEGGPPYPPAALNADGTFSAQAPAGQYKVVVEAIPPAEGGRPDPLAEGGIDYSQAKPVKSLVPLKYARPETSDVTIVVTTNAENKRTIALR
jgi:hypothetical protein